MENRTRVLWVEKAEFLQGWGIKEHAHDYYHLFYILEGNGTFQSGGTVFCAEPGTCLLFPPQTFHALEKVSDKMVSYEVKFLILDEELKSRMNGQAMYCKGNSFFDIMISYIVENGRSRIPHFIWNTDNYLSALLIHLCQDCVQPETSNAELIDTSGFSEITVKIVNYIERCYMNHIYLEDIAGYVGNNRNYICSVFKKDTGMTVFDYLNYVRIRKACEYISYSDIDIGQICYRVGFTNVSHFNRTFKKFTGMPPGLFNKLYPLDVSGNQGSVEQMVSALDAQVQIIADVVGTLHDPQNAGKEHFPAKRKVP